MGGGGGGHTPKPTAAVYLIVNYSGHTSAANLNHKAKAYVLFADKQTKAFPSVNSLHIATLKLLFST